MGILSLFRPCSPPFLSSLFSQSGACYTISTFTFVVEVVMYFQAPLYAVYYITHVLLAGLVYLWKKLREVMDTKSHKLLKEARVLERILNASLKGRLVPCFVLGVSIAECFAGSVLLSMSDQLGKVERYFFVLIYFQTGLCVRTLLTIMSYVFIKSTRYKKALHRSAVKKVERKELMSWKPLRVEFGQNFVDELTPLVVEENVINQTISFAVMYRNK